MSHNDIYSAKSTGSLNSNSIHIAKASISTDEIIASEHKTQIQGIRRKQRFIYFLYAAMAGIVENSTPHYLKHTFATNLLSNGTDLHSVQEILGHSSVSTTEIYTEVTTKRKKQVLNKYNYRNKL